MSSFTYTLVSHTHLLSVSSWNTSSSRYGGGAWWPRRASGSWISSFSFHLFSLSTERRTISGRGGCSERGRLNVPSWRSPQYPRVCLVL